jgi:hypothetical protein
MIVLRSALCGSETPLHCSINRGEAVCIRAQHTDVMRLFDLLTLSHISDEDVISIEGRDGRSLPAPLVQIYRRNTVMMRATTSTQTVADFLRTLFLFTTPQHRTIVDDVLRSLDLLKQKDAPIASLKAYDLFRLYEARISSSLPKMVMCDDFINDCTTLEKQAIASMLRTLSAAGVTIVLFLRHPELFPFSCRVLDAITEQNSLPSSAPKASPSLPHASSISHTKRHHSLVIQDDRESARDAQETSSTEDSLSIPLSPSIAQSSPSLIIHDVSDDALVSVRIQEEMTTRVRATYSRVLQKKIKEEEVAVRIEQKAPSVQKVAPERRSRKERSFEPARYVPKNKKLATPVLKEDIHREAKSLPVFSRKG